jgi:hypothetical protein
MNLTIMSTLWGLCALSAGALIGISFGLFQHAAWRRYKKLQQAGGLNDGWAIMPGSLRRVAYLLVALALVQLVCPLLFKDGCQWWVSGGVAAGYGAMLYIGLRQRLTQPN